ncbi:MAG: AAA-like domain-containing protein [Polyangiaceae bacterium]
MPTIFISYKRDAKDDEFLVKVIQDHFAADHDIFIDKQIPPGAEWAKRIKDELESRDFVFVLMSEASIASEMVRGEIETVRNAFDGSKPRLVPIRVRYAGKYPYPLNAYLDQLQWADWAGEHDTDKVLKQLASTLNGADVSPASSPAPRVSVPPPSLNVEDCHVVRDEENTAVRLLTRTSGIGVTLNLVGPRQMGKTQLLQRANRAARTAGKHVAVIDFKLFDGATLRDNFYESFCLLLSDALAVDVPIASSFGKFPPPYACTRHIKSALSQRAGRTVLVLDELTRLIAFKDHADFFAMLRSWHESRPDGAQFDNLDLVLVAALDLHDFTKGKNSSPFNVGTSIVLKDFKESETLALVQNRTQRVSLAAASKLHGLLSGHPWLTQLALDAVEGNSLTLSEASTVAELLVENGPFNDHLRSGLFGLQALPPTAQSELAAALAGRSCSESTFATLAGAGFLSGTAAIPRARCALYKTFFQQYFPA